MSVACQARLVSDLGQIEVKSFNFSFMKDRIRIGIVGAGIAGCSAALFARDLFPDAEITILEASHRVGGRINSVSVQGRIIEVGASFVHSSNVLMWTMLNRLGLATQRPGHARDLASVGFVEGRQILMRLDRGQILSSVRALASYGASMITVIRLTRLAMRRWASLYRRTETNRFESCSELLASCDLSAMARMPFWSLLASRHVSARLAAEVLSSVTRGIFMQDLEINGLAGLVSLIAAGVGGGESRSIVGGNIRLCERLHEAASARMQLSTDIEHIEIDGPWRVVAVGRDNHRHVFNAIISAIPRPLSSDVDGRRWQPAECGNRRHSICTTLVVGRLAPEYFRPTARMNTPTLILSTSGSQLPFTTLGRTGSATCSGSSIYKLQSHRPLHSRYLNQVFVEIGELQTADWNDCPDLSPSAGDRRFRLTKGVYDASALEQVISTMESQLIGSKNAVGLLVDDWLSRWSHHTGAHLDWTGHPPERPGSSDRHDRVVPRRRPGASEVLGEDPVRLSR